VQYWEGVGEGRSAMDTKMFEEKETGWGCCYTTKGRARKKEERALLDGGATRSSQYWRNNFFFDIRSIGISLDKTSTWWATTTSIKAVAT
jgi:hypothetical protein